MNLDTIDLLIEIFEGEDRPVDTIEFTIVDYFRIIEKQLKYLYPIANVTFQIYLPDGSEKECITDKDGKILIKNIDIRLGNECQICYKVKNAKYNSYMRLHFPRQLLMHNDNGDQPQPDPSKQALSWYANVTTGGAYIIKMYHQQIVFDMHMHIQSGNCTPLPLLWNYLNVGLIKLGFWTQPKRKTISSVGKKMGGKIIPTLTATIYFSKIPVTKSISEALKEAKKGWNKSIGMADLSKLQEKSTDAIGDLFMEERYNLYQKYDEFKNLKLLLPSIVMTMDMHYAHIDGYYGVPIYIRYYKDTDIDRTKPFYAFPLHLDSIFHNRTEEENPRSKLDKTEREDEYFTDIYPQEAWNKKVLIVPMADEETALYERWDKQLANTKKVVAKYPWVLLPMYHYDPRRWINKKNWMQPIEEEVLNGLFIGIKMYTSLGYKPFDIHRLPNLHTLYRICVDNKIPITCHCTPEGLYTFDRLNYLDFIHEKDTAKDRDEQLAYKHWHGDDELGYFLDNFVSPNAWVPVLNAFKELRLCLAHWGGTDCEKEKTSKNKVAWFDQMVELMLKFSNFYTDISYSLYDESFREKLKSRMQKQPLIKDHVLFGTDWYLIKQDRFDYKKYCHEAKEYFDTFDTSLWEQITLINPLKFLRLDLRAINISKAMKEISAKNGPAVDDEQIELGVEVVEVLYQYYRNLLGIKFVDND